VAALGKTGVHITTGSVHRAMHTPGGVVHNFDVRLAEAITARAESRSPVNDPLNALHRAMWGGGVPRGRSSLGFKTQFAVVGTYKKSWDWRMTTGSNRSSSKVLIGNSAPHAEFVEFGRSASYKYQAFSWSKAPFIKMRRGERPYKNPGWKWYLITAGGQKSLLDKTNARSGKHILRDSTAKALRKWGIPFVGVSV
jgi:hypothetical protein